MFVAAIVLNGGKSGTSSTGADWDAWCRAATRSHEVIGTEQITWREYGAAEMQAPGRSDPILCDDPEKTLVDPNDGHFRGYAP